MTSREVSRGFPMLPGIQLDRHYSYRICGPARSALLSGRLAPHVLVKNVAVTASNPEDPISGYAGIPRNMTGMGEKLRQGGYRTHYTGTLGVILDMLVDVQLHP